MQGCPRPCPTGLEFAPVGLTNMLNGGGAVRGVHAERVEVATVASMEGESGWRLAMRFVWHSRDAQTYPFIYHQRAVDMPEQAKMTQK